MSFFDEEVFFKDEGLKNAPEKDTFSMPSGAAKEGSAGLARKRRRADKIKLIASTAAVTAVVLIGGAMLTVLIRGRGWAANMILGGKNIEFTLPVADYPTIDIADNRYRRQGRIRPLHDGGARKGGKRHGS